MDEEKTPSGRGGRRPGAGRKRVLPLDRFARIGGEEKRRNRSIYCTIAEYRACKELLEELRKHAAEQEAEDREKAKVFGSVSFEK